MDAFDSFAVIDVETTGLSPRYHHRVIEIGIVKVARTGQILEEYETLVNPNRDLGPTHIHGIRARDLMDAPEFQDIAGDVMAMLGNSVFVAHNVRFDYLFVDSEYARLGGSLGNTHALCTMELADEVIPNASCRALSAIRRQLGLAVQPHHSAIHDARAAAAILCRYLNKFGDRKCTSLVKALGHRGARGPLVLPRTGRRKPRVASGVANRNSNRFLASLIERLPSYKDATPQSNSYLVSLDRALSDRVLTEEESIELQALAQDLGLVREQVEQVHSRYLSDLVALALADGKLSDAEKDELRCVADILAIPEYELAARWESCDHDSQGSMRPASQVSIDAGDVPQYL